MNGQLARWIAVATCFCIYPSRNAWADPVVTEKATEHKAGSSRRDAKRLAKSHYMQGTAFYKAKMYAQAAAEFEAAYRFVPLAEFLFNIAQANRGAGDQRRALEYYGRYLEAEPEGGVSDEARSQVVVLTRALTANSPSSSTKQPAGGSGIIKDGDAQSAQKQSGRLPDLKQPFKHSDLKDPFGN